MMNESESIAHFTTHMPPSTTRTFAEASDQIQQWFVHSSPHGVRRISRATTRSEQILWSFIFVIFAVLMGTFIYSAIAKYLDHPARIHLSIKHDLSSDDYPAITLCESIGVPYRSGDELCSRQRQRLQRGDPAERALDERRSSRSLRLQRARLLPQSHRTIPSDIRQLSHVRQRSPRSTRRGAGHAALLVSRRSRRRVRLPASTRTRLSPTGVSALIRPPSGVPAVHPSEAGNPYALAEQHPPATEQVHETELLAARDVLLARLSHGADR